MWLKRQGADVKGNLQPASFGFEHRLLSRPVAKKCGPSLLPACSSDGVRFNRGKKSFCQHEMLGCLADLLQIDSDLDAVSNRQQRAAMGVSEIESKAADPAFLVHKGRLAAAECAKFQLDRVEAAIPPQHMTEKAVSDDVMVTIVLESKPLHPVSFIGGKPAYAPRLHVR